MFVENSALVRSKMEDNGRVELNEYESTEKK